MSQLNGIGQWLGITTVAGEVPDLRMLKSQLTQHGVNSRGWRLLLDHGDATFKPLWTEWPGKLDDTVRGACAIAWLRVLQGCEMDVLPPPELVSSIARWKVPAMQLLEIPPLFLRAAWKAVITAQYLDDDSTSDEFVLQDVVPLAQWFFDSGAYKVVGPDRLKAGWSSLKRLRRESIASHASQLSSADWPPVVQRYASGPFVLTALCRDDELTEEGKAMKHCVGSYGERCRTEPLRIFSIRHQRSGTRVATLSVREAQPGSWVVDQIKGISNAKVNDLPWPEVQELIQLMNAVSRDDKALRCYLDFVRNETSS